MISSWLMCFPAWRRFQAVQWLESLVGPLGIPNQPSEREFISCLRNGLILCNAINKIHPGTVPKVLHYFSFIWKFFLIMTFFPQLNCSIILIFISVTILSLWLHLKVVEIQLPLQSFNLEMRPLPAYQYFENVRNFLVAVDELKLPAFEASDLERVIIIYETIRYMLSNNWVSKRLWFFYILFIFLFFFLVSGYVGSRISGQSCRLHFGP